MTTTASLHRQRLHRHCVLSLASWQETLDRFSALCTPEVDGLIVSHLAVEHPFLPHMGFNALNKTLGQSYGAVLLDLSQGLHLSALAMVAGTVNGGGLFVIYLGEDWQHSADLELARCLPWPLEAETQTSFYKSLFWDALTQPDSPFSTQWPGTWCPSVTSDEPNTLTEEQASLISNMLSTLDQASAHLLLAPRGRGKSYALGCFLAQTQRNGLSVMSTAATLHNVVTLKSAFEQGSGVLPFQAPDALLASNQTYGVLVVDEAASLPLPMLNKLLNKAAHIVFSSTDYGYEGSGRGFGIRFVEQLAQHQRQVFSHRLTQPIRWGENDPLESWLHQCLFSDYHASFRHPHQPATVRGRAWLQHPQLLDQTFALLVSAHYQTTPDNKRWLVDDPSVITFLQYNQDRLIAVALVIEEGRLPDELAQQVAQGRRRPRGHLLPQSLLAHEGIEDAGAFSYWRISRIAVAASQQRQGRGSQLVQGIQTKAKEESIDFVCTSFAATADVIAFWQHNHFQSVRLGTSQDHASGSYSLMMLHATSARAEPKQNLWHGFFARHWHTDLTLGLRTLPDDLCKALTQECAFLDRDSLHELNNKDLADLHYFCDHHRPYDTIRTALYALVLLLRKRNQLDTQTPQDSHLLGCAFNTLSEKDAHRLGFDGKKAFYRALKERVSRELEKLSMTH